MLSHPMIPAAPVPTLGWDVQPIPDTPALAVRLVALATGDVWWETVASGGIDTAHLTTIAAIFRTGGYPVEAFRSDLCL